MLAGTVDELETAPEREMRSYEVEAGINSPPAVAGDMLIVTAGMPVEGESSRAWLR